MKIETGVVSSSKQLNGKKPILFAISLLECADPAAGQHLPPDGTAGVLTLKDVPNTPFQKGEQILYQDSNNNNTMRFTISANVGVTKYKITMRQ